MASFLGDRESLKPRRKRGRLQQSTAETTRRPPSKSEEEEEEEDDDDTEEEEDEDDESESESEEEEPTPKKARVASKGIDPKAKSPSPASTYGPWGSDDGWSKEDMDMLLQKLKGVMPDHDTVKYSTQAERVNWKDVEFGSHSATDCKVRWKTMSTKLRRYRTMTELLEEAMERCRMPWNATRKHTKKVKHPDEPKKPLTPYFRYFMEKRAQCQKENPNRSTTDISQMLAKKFHALPEKKKKKYIDEYNQETEAYKLALEKFKAQHPEYFKEPEEKEKNNKMKNGTSETETKNGNPPKTTTAVQIFIQSKTEEHIKKEPSVTRKQCQELYRTRWNQLPDRRKLRYILKAVEAKEDYDKRMEEYCELHPDYQPRFVKSFLSKPEQKIKDKHDGKPDKPPANGYGLFSTIMIRKMTDVPSNERMAEVSRLWKALSQGERDKYNRDSEQRWGEYKRAYQKFLDELSPEQREKMEAEKHRSSKAKVTLANKAAALANTERPQRPVSALFLYMNEKKEKYKKKYPNMNSQEITRLLSKEYSSLPEEKKAKYKKMEEEEKKKLAQQQDEQVEALSREAAKARNYHFPGEPKKSPASGYQLFSTEMLIKMVDVPSHQRMAALSQKWKVMTDKEKKEYNTRRDNMVKQYNKDLEKFKKKLSAKDLKKFTELEAQRKMKRKGVGKANPKAKKPVEKSESEAEEEEEEEEEEEDEENDESGSEEESDAEEEDDEDDDEEEEGSDDEEEESSEETKTPPKPAQNGPTKGSNAAEAESSSEAGSGSEEEEEEEEEEDEDEEESDAENAASESEAESLSETTATESEEE